MNAMMDHRDEEVRRLDEAGNWLLQLKDDDLSEEELQKWLNWCEADPANLNAFERVQALWRGIPTTMPDFIRVKALTPALSRGPGEGVRRWPRRFLPGTGRRIARVALAAGIAAVAGFVSFMTYERWFGQESIAAIQIEAPQRVNRNALLPDGSQMNLAAGSTVAVIYGYEERRLKMQDGRAFFRVKPDKARPFVVEAGPVSVTAIGTAFNVRRNGERVVVTVEEGTVRIDKEKDKGSLEATAGYQLTYDAESGEARLTPVNPTVEMAWLEGRLVYNGEPLETVIANVNRYSAKKITLADPRLGELRYTGTVFVDSIDNWLSALPRAFPIVVKTEESGTLLTARD